MIILMIVEPIKHKEDNKTLTNNPNLKTFLVIPFATFGCPFPKDSGINLTAASGMAKVPKVMNKEVIMAKTDATPISATERILVAIVT